MRFLLLFLVPLTLQAQSLRFEAVELPTDAAGHGIAVADGTGDGIDDLFIAAFNGTSVFLRGDGAGGFVDVTAEAGLSVSGNAAAPAWADVDNDGHPDLYVGIRGGSSPNKLFRNRGDGTFEDVLEAAGLDAEVRVGAVTWGDFDADGRVDLFVGTRDAPDQLYRNVSTPGDIRFEDLSGRGGTKGSVTSIAMQATWFDADHDGDLDLFAVHDSQVPNRFYRNEGFLPMRDIARGIGVDVVAAGNAMGVAWSDVDGDGWEDVYVSRIGTASLYRNLGDGTFELTPDAAGAAQNGMSWGSVFADLDNDLDEDLFVVSSSGFDRTPMLLYEHEAGRFTETGQSAGVRVQREAYGAASLDANQDGLPDLVLADEDGQSMLFLNRTETTGTWAKLRLTGSETNRMAIGTRVEATVGSRTLLRTVGGGDSYCAQSSQTLHLGLGDATQIDALAIYWADGRTERYENLGAGTVHTIVEGSGLVTTNVETAPEAMTLGLAMFPNPARGGVNASLRIGDPSTVRLEVYDLLGRRVLTPVTQRLPAGTHDLRVDVSALPAGLYIARAVTPNAERTIRFAVAE